LLPFVLLLFLIDCSMMREENFAQLHSRFSSGEITESSELLKSRQFEDVFWTHNDRGDRARIFAITSEGELIREVKISGAQNVDWEDMAIDDAGHLYIGDIGNDRGKNKDLTIYMLKEPNPFESEEAAVIKRIHFSFPDLPRFHKTKKEKVDCEALFWANGNLYCMTKYRHDGFTKLYRFDSIDTNTHQVLTKIAEFQIDGAVTSSDVSIDGNKLLVLCYEFIYLFEKPADSDNYLAGKFKRIPITAGKSEGICFADSEVFFSNEEGEIYKLTESVLDARGTN